MATSAAQFAIDTQSDAVKAMAESWPMIEALRGGTDAMRKAGGRFLPKQPRESALDYELRAQVATLYPALNRTISVMCGKPFSKQLTLSEDVPPTLRSLAQNIDAQGRSLHTFAYDVLEEVMAFGVAGVLIDKPVLRVEKGRPPTALDERQQGIQPYWAFVRHGDILGWRSTVVAGKMKLTQLRIAEQIEQDDGEYGTAFQAAVRVLRPGSWELHRRSGDAYTLAPEDQGSTGLPYIPFVPFYGKRRQFMIGEPPLLDLAHLNVKHYQVQSDQDDSARFARKRLLVFSGVPKNQMTEVEVSSSSAISLADKDAKVEVVQGSAESVTVGRNELNDLEEQMVRTGAELLVMQPGGQRTATQDNNEAEGNKSDLQRIVEVFEDSLDQCLQITAEMQSLLEGGHAQLFKDFGAGNLDTASAQLIVTMQGAGLLSKETALKEQQRRGMISADIDVDAELEKIDAEGPPPPAVDDLLPPVPPQLKLL